MSFSTLFSAVSSIEFLVCTIIDSIFFDFFETDLSSKGFANVIQITYFLDNSSSLLRSFSVRSFKPFFPILLRSSSISSCRSLRFALYSSSMVWYFCSGLKMFLTDWLLLRAKPITAIKSKIIVNIIIIRKKPQFPIFRIGNSDFVF